MSDLDDWYDDGDFDNEPVCRRCWGDGRDPDCDYLLPCPACQGEQSATPLQITEEPRNG